MRIREAVHSDLGNIKKMTDDYIGENFYTMPYLEEICNANDKFLYVYANDDDEAVAYLYIFISTLGEALSMLNVPCGDSGFDAAEMDSMTGVYKTTCTMKEYRSRGLLASFLGSLEDVVRRKGAAWILAPALRTPSGAIPVRKHLLGMGFKMAAAVARPWTHIDSLCPYCGSENCLCDCILYVKEMAKLDE